LARRYDWIFLDAGETLFRVTAPSAEYGAVLAELGYLLSHERMLAAFERARSEGLSADHVGPPPDHAIHGEAARARRERFVAALVRAIGVRPEHERMARAILEESFVGRTFFSLYPEVPGVLEELRRRGYRLAIISNWEPRLELLCRSHGLASSFEFVLASEAEGFAKPGPHLFRRALELSRATPQRAVHVGDSYEHDVLGARAVGLEAILLDRGGYYSAGLWRPTIRSLAELPELV
jgi:putative hydrolase of the HAD superfamily